MHVNDLSSVLKGIRPGGCVQPYVEGFAAQLVASGYTVLSTRDAVTSATHFGRWMDLCGIGIDTVTASTVVRFATHDCMCPGAGEHHRLPSRRFTARVRRFVEYLRSVGLGRRIAAPRPKAGPAPLIGFRTWMTRHRGVTSRTIERYEDLVGKMLPALGDDPGSYDASLVRRVLLDVIRGRSHAYAKGFVTALRAFLRFLATEGRCQACIVEAVPTIYDWKLSALPRYLETDDVERVIASCNLKKPHGVRNRAVLLLLARLGLRAGDIVGMRLDDLDWEAGTVRVRGKGRKEVCLPLPQETGEALIEYLVHVRPTADTDRVFLCANAPVRPFATSAAVSDIVRVALGRAGISDPPTKGAHLLRHSAATTMLRSGASLDAIATVLRHDSSDTTAYYAKVDIDLLLQVTQPWPEGASC